jgi:hypothetical protein
MGIVQWAAVLDTVGGLVQVARRMGQGAVDGLAGPQGGPGNAGQMEARLAGVVVAALKEVFERDSVRLELERSQIDADRRRADDLLRVELRRQAADRTVAQLRLIAVLAVTTWAVSAVLCVWMPGMRAVLPRVLVGAGWAFALGTLGSALAGWQQASLQAADTSSAGGAVLDRGATGFTSGASRAPRPPRAPSWLLVTAMALTGAGLLAAL